MSDICLNCLLAECDENDPDCLFWENRLKPRRKYCERMKHDPEFRKRHYVNNKKYRQTEAGKKSASECAMRWQKKNPEAAKAIRDKYIEKNRDKINATRREWRAKRARETE